MISILKNLFGMKDNAEQSNSNGAAKKAEKPKYHKISSKEAMEMMDKNTVILDVRTREEYNQGHIPKAVALPANQIMRKAASALPKKDQVILVYCYSGGRSRPAAKALVRMGYTRVYDFGGLIRWSGKLVK